MNKVLRFFIPAFSALLTIIATACSNDSATDDLSNKNGAITEDEKTENDGSEKEEEQPASLTILAKQNSNQENPGSICGGLRLTFDMSGISRIELESVDGYNIAGTAALTYTDGVAQIGEITKGNSIISFKAMEEGGLTPGVEYCIYTLPCDLYGGYRLSIYKDGLVAHYFGVHQVVEAYSFITPLDLIESELAFDDPDAPLVEEDRPELDDKTKALAAAYRKNPIEENKQALMEQMGIRYDKVVARKKAKLRELEREAKHQALVEEMQAIVDEMVENREIRLEQQFLRLIDPRTDDNPNDAWMVLRGANAKNAYIGYAPVTNAEYAQFDTSFTYNSGEENYPVVNISITEATAYCKWLSSKDSSHLYRLPDENEWVLGAGHMPKDVAMNSNRIESGLTAVDAYKESTGACGGIDFWGNCWEWTTTQSENGEYIVKGGSWDSDRDECRSEYSGATRNGENSYANVGFRVVRVDK